MTVCRKGWSFARTLWEELKAVLWLQEFLQSKGMLEGGARKDPTLAEFEAELAKYHTTQNEILVRIMPT